MFNKRITAKVTKVLKTKKTGVKKEKKNSPKEVEQNPDQLVAKVVNNVPSGPEGYNFDVGSKFLLDGIIYTVKAQYIDSNSTKIKVYSLEQGEEVMSLNILKKDIKNDTTFKVLEKLMSDIEIRILPSGDIHISRSIHKENNDKMLELLNEVVEDKESLKTFLKSADDCEQIIGDSPLCG